MIHYGYVAASQLSALEPQLQKRIAEKMKFYAQQKDPLAFAKYIIQRKSYRFRVGDYRIFFDLKDSMIYVTKIIRRDKAYD